MAIELPRAGAGSAGTGGRTRTVRPTTAADVPTVSVTADPAVTIPNVAQFDPDADVGAAISDVGTELQAAENRIQTRQDAVSRARELGIFRKAATDELLKSSDESNLSPLEIADNYNQFLRDAMSTTLNAHEGSAESR